MNDEFTPVKEGEELDVKIEAIGEKGDGIAKVERFDIFVKDTKQGDSVRIRITKVMPKMSFAEVISDTAQEQQPVEEETPDDTENFGEDPEKK